MNQFLTNADVPVIVGMYNILIPLFSRFIHGHVATPGCFSIFILKKLQREYGCWLVKNHISIKQLDCEPEISIAR